MRSFLLCLVGLVGATVALNCTTQVRSTAAFNGDLSEVGVLIGKLIPYSVECEPADGSEPHCYSVTAGPLFFSGCEDGGLPFMADFKIPICQTTHLPGETANCDQAEFDGLGHVEVCCCKDDDCHTAPPSTTTKVHTTTSPTDGTDSSQLPQTKDTTEPPVTHQHNTTDPSNGASKYEVVTAVVSTAILVLAM